MGGLLLCAALKSFPPGKSTNLTNGDCGSVLIYLWVEHKRESTQPKRSLGLNCFFLGGDMKGREDS